MATVRPRSSVFAALLLALAACASPGTPGTPGGPGTAKTAAPAPVTTIALDATIAADDGVAIRYHSEGQGSPALVFVHGWGCDRSHWTEQVAHFAPTHQVVTLDLPGHGASGKNRREWTLQAYGEDVRAVVKALDLRRVVLIGHSMGGPVVLEAARRMPDRVVAVIGVDTFHDVERRMDTKQADDFLARWRKDFPGTLHEMVSFLMPKNPDPAFRERIETEMAQADPEMAVTLLENLFRYDLAAGFDAVHAPIRAINTTMPTNVEADRRHSPGFAVVDLSGTGLGHFPMLETPALFDQKLEELLAGLPAGAPAAARPSR